MTATPEATADATPETPDAALDSVAAKIRDFLAPSTNVNGWTGARQRRFLEAIADGETITDACTLVSLSTASAYAFRRRAKGRAFDLGWKAADLLARERVAADLMVRATDGQEVTITRDDGTTTTKHHHDNRLALQMLARLDRYADSSERTAPGHAARMVAGDFDAYLDLVGAEGGPARAGLFMLARSYGVDGADGAQPAAELEPIIALARADRTLRCGTLAADVDVADLDPARRADWTAGQWARAEACGLLVLAPAPAPEPEPEPANAAATCQPVSTSPQKPVWFCDVSNQWRTYFAPPEDFTDEEDGTWSDPEYERQLTEEECALLGLSIPGSDEDLAEAEAERDAWFAEHAVAATPESKEEDKSSPLPPAGLRSTAPRAVEDAPGAHPASNGAGGGAGSDTSASPEDTATPSHEREEKEGSASIPPVDSAPAAPDATPCLRSC